MKYTVVIRQPVTDELRRPLEQALRDRFGLSGDQAQRLSARRAGRLMKPTSRTRAELLLSVFQSVGAQVTLEEVREETGLLTEPFQGVARLPTPALSAEGTPDDAPLAPLLAVPNPAHTLFQTPAAPWPDAPAGAAATAAGPVPNGPVPSGTVPTGPASADVMSGVSLDWDALAAPAPVLPGGPDSPFTPSSLPYSAAPAGASPSGLSASGVGVSGAVSEGGAGARGTAAGVAALLDAPAASPASNPFADLPQAGTPEFSFADVMPAAPRAGGDVTTTDVWTDFTGSLTLHDSKAGPDPKATSITPVLTANLDAGSPAARARRRPLSGQLALGSLLPLALSGAVTLVLLGVGLPTLQRQLVQQSAQAVAVAVGTNLNTGGGNSVQSQINGLVANSNVGFVRVELPDGRTFFRSKTPAQDRALNREVSDWSQANPESGRFRAAAGGASYEVNRVIVSGRGGQRVISTGMDTAGANLLYRITVGVSDASAAALLRNTLLLVLGVFLLALILAALLAVRAARRVVEPIQHLVKVADSISLGDLTRPVQSGRNDEIGDLAAALERMRLSLEAAMDRLRRRQKRA